MQAGDARQAQLAQAQPELEDFRRPGALQPRLAPMAPAPAGFHVGKPGAEGLLECRGSASNSREEVLVMPRSFWGLTVIESAWPRPARPVAVPITEGEDRPDGPVHMQPVAPGAGRGPPSARRGSTAPRTVVPAVATTAITGMPGVRSVPSLLFERLGLEAARGIDRQPDQGLRPAGPSPRRPFQRHMGILTAEHHRIAAAGQAALPAGRAPGPSDC